MFYSYKENYLTYRSSSNPDIQLYKQQDTTQLLTPKAPTITKMELDAEMFGHSSGIGYEGPLLKKLTKPTNNEELLDQMEENE